MSQEIQEVLTNEVIQNRLEWCKRGFDLSSSKAIEVLESHIAQQYTIDQLKTVVGEYEFWIKNIGNPAKTSLELAVKALEKINAKYMEYIENSIESDYAALKMDEIAEKTLEEIKRLGEGVNK